MSKPTVCSMATFTKEQLIAVCRADVASMTTFLRDSEYSNPSRAALYLRITEIALAALEAKPFMYGMKDGYGDPWFSEHCVSTNPAHLLDEQEEAEEEDGLRIVPLYLPNKLVEDLK